MRVEAAEPEQGCPSDDGQSLASPIPTGIRGGLFVLVSMVEIGHMWVGMFERGVLVGVAVATGEPIRVDVLVMAV